MNYKIGIANSGLESQQILYNLENGHPASGALTSHVLFWVLRVCICRCVIK